MRIAEYLTRSWPVCAARVRAGVVLLGALVIAACGSGGGPSGNGAAGNGTAGASAPSTAQACNGCGGALVSLTDAPGDFLNYIVDVVSLQLTRSDGTVVQAVPATSKVDFAQLVNLAEIISSAQIPAGRYVSAAITLNYSGATIIVDNGTSGVTIGANNIIDGATSTPLNAPNPTQLTLTVSLPANAPLVVTPGTVANLALDFNLAASNAITPSATAPTTVTVNPVLTASLVPDAIKQLRVHGGLVSTSAGGNSFVVNVQPFDTDSGSSGQVTVQTTATTTFTINGTGYSGSAGLAQLATESAGTMTAAYGAYDITTQVFTASSVLVGSSVAGAKLDSVTGTVLARSGNNLTIADCTALHAGLDDQAYLHQVTATLGAATAVSEQGVSGAFTIQDISVGQRVQVSGTLSTSAAGAATIDVTAGNVLLLPTNLAGTVTAVAANLVTIDLQSLAGQPAANLQFAGTGATSAQDAAATAYTVSLPAAFSASSVTVGAPVSFTGFVTPFGAAPPDFAASTLVSYANAKAELEVQWAVGVTAPFASLSGTALSISQATLSASALHAVRLGFARIDPSTLAGGVQLVPDAAATNPGFTIGHQTSWTADSYSTFSDFVTALTTDLNGTATALAVEAVGPYDTATGVLSVDRMLVILNN